MGIQKVAAYFNTWSLWNLVLKCYKCYCRGNSNSKENYCIEKECFNFLLFSKSRYSKKNVAKMNEEGANFQCRCDRFFRLSIEKIIYRWVLENKYVFLKVCFPLKLSQNFIRINKYFPSRPTRALAHPICWRKWWRDRASVIGRVWSGYIR